MKLTELKEATKPSQTEDLAHELLMETLKEQTAKKGSALSAGECRRINNIMEARTESVFTHHLGDRRLPKSRKGKGKANPELPYWAQLPY
jgi:hypothetical protein